MPPRRPRRSPEPSSGRRSGPSSATARAQAPARRRGGAPAPAAHRDAVTAHVTKKGLRWTRQRELLLETFLASRDHLTCDEIHARVAALDPSLGLATAYRTLRLFVEAGIASERRFQDGVTRYEVQQQHHDHLICTACGRIVEFESDAIERLQDDVARSHGFRLQSHRHELYGRCEECQGS